MAKIPQNLGKGKDNCLQLSLACLFELEIDKVPDFVQSNGKEFNKNWVKACEKWINKRGYDIIIVEIPPYTRKKRMFKERGGFYLVLGQSYLSSKKGNKGDWHAVVYRGDKLFFDPNPLSHKKDRKTGITRLREIWLFVPHNPKIKIGLFDKIKNLFKKGQK